VRLIHIIAVPFTQPVRLPAIRLGDAIRVAVAVSSFLQTRLRFSTIRSAAVRTSSRQ